MSSDALASFRTGSEYRTLRAALGARAFPPTRPHKLESQRGPGYSNVLLAQFALHGASPARARARRPAARRRRQRCTGLRGRGRQTDARCPRRGGGGGRLARVSRAGLAQRVARRALARRAR